MIIIPGQLITLLTFPGIIVHEIGHRFFCDVAGVPVYDVCYLRPGNPAGYVIHGKGASLKQAFFVSFGPLIVNTVLCAVLTFAVVCPLIILDVKDPSPVYLLLAWVGYSVGIHAFPSDHDVDSYLIRLKDAHSKAVWPVRIVSWLLTFGNRIIWIRIAYAAAVSFILPLVLGLCS